MKLKPNASQKYVLKLAVPKGLTAGTYYSAGRADPCVVGDSSDSLADALAGVTPLVVN